MLEELYRKFDKFKDKIGIPVFRENTNIEKEPLPFVIAVRTDREIQAVFQGKENQEYKTTESIDLILYESMDKIVEDRLEAILYVRDFWGSYRLDITNTSIDVQEIEKHPIYIATYSINFIKYNKKLLDNVGEMTEAIIENG